jgi:Subtilase family
LKVSHRTKKGKKKTDSLDTIPQSIVIRFAEQVRNLPYIDSLEKLLPELGLSDLYSVFQEFPGLTMDRLFTSLNPNDIKNMMEQSSSLDNDYEPPNLLLYYRLILPPNIRAEEVVKKLNDLSEVDEVYLEGGPTPPPMANPANNPRYRNQVYLLPAQNGIDAEYAWTIPGGDGSGVGFIDLEQGWTLNHEDLIDRGITLISGMNQAYFGHGTAVLGEVLAVDNNIGDIGIAHGVRDAALVSQYRTSSNYNTADAILSAESNLEFGDVLLLEAQVNYNNTRYLPVEVESAVFDVIRLATARQIIVVQAAGNGKNDLDNFITLSGKQVLNRHSPDFKDSGAIMVGAGTSQVPHERWSTSTLGSNYGNRIDCYAWGENIDTTGDPYLPSAQHALNYTSSMGGTSGASAIISGAALSLQGIAKAFRPNSITISPNEMRLLLSSPNTSTPSADPLVDRIGVMPDLRLIINNRLTSLKNIVNQDNHTDIIFTD